MTEALKDFYEKPIADFFMANIEPDDPDALFVIRWDDKHFAKLRDFLRFTNRFASLMQFSGPDFRDEDVSGYFSEPPQLEWSTDYDFKTYPPQTKDLKSTLNELYPNIQVPWMSKGDHTKTMAIIVDGDCNFISHGPNGYVNAFVAHDVDFEYG